MHPSDKQSLQNILAGIGIAAVGHILIFAASFNVPTPIPFWAALVVDGAMAGLVGIIGVFGVK